MMSIIFCTEAKQVRSITGLSRPQPFHNETLHRANCSSAMTGTLFGVILCDLAFTFYRALAKMLASSFTTERQREALMNIYLADSRRVLELGLFACLVHRISICSAPHWGELPIFHTSSPRFWSIPN